MDLLTPTHERFWLRVIFPVLLALSFASYIYFGQRYIGACDWYGYYQEAQLLANGQLQLDTPLPATQFPSQVPLGFAALNGRTLPQYPPGYPVLLGAAGTFGLEFFVSPCIGLLSALLLFAILRQQTTPLTASLFAVLWAASAIVVYGSTSVMSDLLATTCLLGAYWAYRQDRLFLSALIFGYGIAVRPSNILLAPTMVILLWGDPRRWRYLLYLLVPGSLYGWYNTIMFDAPWRTGYLDITPDLSPAVFVQHSLFYLRVTLLQFSPLLLFWAVYTWRRPSREKFAWAISFLGFWLFYSFWRSGGDRWWWCRFLLPGYPALFILAAMGFHEWREHRRTLDAAAPHARRWLVPVMTLLLALLPIYLVVYGYLQHDLWKTNKGRDYYRVVKQVETLVPPGSYVGSIEFCGSMRLYTPQLQPFLSFHDNAHDLLAYTMPRGHAAYVLVEPWNRQHVGIQKLLRHFAATKVSELNIWGGIDLYQLNPPAPPTP